MPNLRKGVGYLMVLLSLAIFIYVIINLFSFNGGTQYCFQSNQAGIPQHQLIQQVNFTSSSCDKTQGNFYLIQTTSNNYKNLAVLLILEWIISAIGVTLTRG